MTEKILYLEKRGIDFSKNDDRVKNSDVGNYRITTTGYNVTDTENGRTYFLEFSRFTRNNIRRENLRTGKPLKTPVITIDTENGLYMDNAFMDGNSCYRDLKKCSNTGEYTLDNILNTVNATFHQDYTKIEFVD